MFAFFNFSQNVKVLVRRLPDVIHAAISMSSLGPANLRPPAHMLLCSLVHCVVAFASTSADPSYSAAEPSTLPVLDIQTSTEYNVLNFFLFSDMSHY